jgi:hypothetical protein
MRHIDADKVMEEINRIGGHNLCEWETIGVKALIDRQPTADVVPKSEVAEIIEEAFKMMQDNFVNTPIYKVFPHRLKAELKKKYTEGG